MRIRSSRRVVLAVFAVSLSACADTAPTPPDPALLSNSGQLLIECPTAVSQTVTAEIDSLGGLIELDGHSISLPVGAVLSPTPFTFTIPASRFVEIHIQANGAHGFEFLEPVLITISYARCNRSLLSPLTAYKIDPETKALLRHMGGIQDVLTRTVVFASDSLSGYSLAE